MPVLRMPSSQGALGNYKRVSKLGSGTFASAHLVQHKETGEQWVMKRIPCKHMRAANAALVEVKVLMSVAHAGIVGYRDFFLDSDSEDNIVICLLMEHCADGDLWEPIAAAQRKKATMDMAQCTVWLLQLIAALRHLHARDVFYRHQAREHLPHAGRRRVQARRLWAGEGVVGRARGAAGNTQCGSPTTWRPRCSRGRRYRGHRRLLVGRGGLRARVLAPAYMLR